MSVESVFQTSVTITTAATNGDVQSSGMGDFTFSGGVQAITQVRFVIGGSGAGLRHQNDGSNDDTYGLHIRIMSGATVLAAATSGGAYQELVANAIQPNASTYTNIGPASITFDWVKSDATDAQWDAAIVEVQQFYDQNMGGDSGQFQLSSGTNQVEVTFTPLGRTVACTTEALTLTTLGGFAGQAPVINLDFSAANAGDELIAVLSCDEQGGFDTPAGWTKIDTLLVNGYDGVDTNYFSASSIYQKSATGSEGIIQWKGLGSTDKILGYAHIIDGNTVETPYVIFKKTPDGIGTQNRVKLPTINPEFNEAVVVAGGVAGYHDGPISETYPGLTQIDGRNVGSVYIDSVTHQVFEATMLWQGVWSVEAVVPVDRYNSAAAGLIDDFLNFGGESGISVFGQNHLFNGTSWSAETDMNYPHYQHRGVGIAQTDAASVCGVGDGVPFQGQYLGSYNGTAWTDEPVSGSLRRFHWAVGTPSDILMGCGDVGGARSAATQEFNGTAWSAGDSLTAARRDAPGVGAPTDVFVAAGYGQSALTNTVEEYNGTAWSAGTNHPLTEDRGMGAGTAIDGMTHGFDQNAATTHLYDGTTWTVGNANGGAANNGGATSGAISDCMSVCPGFNNDYNRANRYTLQSSLSDSPSFWTAYTGGYGGSWIMYYDRKSGEVTGVTEELRLTTNPATVVKSLHVVVGDTPGTVTIEEHAPRIKIRKYKNKSIALKPGFTRVNMVGWAPIITGDQADLGQRFVNCTTEAVTLTTNNATVGRDKTVTTTPEALHVTGNQATVTLSRTVSCATEAIHLTEPAATVARTRDINCTTEALHVTTSAGTVVRPRLVTCASEAVLLSTTQALVDHARLVTGTTEQLTLGYVQSSVTRDRDVTGVTEALLLTESLATVDFTSGKSIISVVPSSFDNAQTGIVVTTEGITTATAEVWIQGVQQTITGTTANTITFTAVRGATPLGATLLTVVEA